MPLLPLFKAIDFLTDIGHTPPLEWASIDFVTDRSNLRALLSWANGSTGELRIDTQLAGHKTVLMNRWTPRPKVSADGVSFGFNFEKKATRV